MTLSVNAIRNCSAVNYSRNNLQTKEALKAQPSFEGNHKSNSMRKVAYVMIGGMMVPVMLTSCDKDDWWLSRSEASAYAEANCKGCCPVDKDTVYIPVNGGRDTITQIINTKDTVYLKDNFKSPVIDTLNVILDQLGDDTSKGYIPVKISYIDEMDTKYKSNIFDGKSSSPNLIVYKGTASPWDDNQGKFVIGTSLDKHDLWQCSLTRDGRLYMSHMVARDNIENPESLADYMYDNKTLIIERDVANKLCKVLNGAGDLVYTLKAKGNSTSDIEATNLYGTTHNLTNVKYQRADSPEGNN